MNLKRWGAIAGTGALLATGAVVGLAVPASAHEAVVTPSATCQSDGTYTITWSLDTSEAPSTYHGASNTYDAWVTAPVSTQIGNDLAPNAGATWVQKGVAGTATSSEASFTETWRDGYALRSSGTTRLDGDCRSTSHQTPTGYQTVVWQMPAKPTGSNSATWPQTFVSATPESTETLDVPVPTTCGTYYQVDSYVDDATTRSLIAAAEKGAKLTAPDNPPESLAPGGENVAWKHVINPDCDVPPAIQACTTPLPDILASNIDDAGWDYSGTRSAGHYDYTLTTLRVWTDDDSAEGEAAGIHALHIPLEDAGVPAMVTTNVVGVAPELQLQLDLNGDGRPDGVLVQQDAPNARTWGTVASGFGVAAGPGYASLGTLDEYLAANPHATIVGVGFQLGPKVAAGVKGSAEIVSITVGCQRFTFDSKPTAATVSQSSGTSPTSAELADTGSSLAFPLVAAGAVMLIGTAALAFAAVRRRREASQQ